VAFGGFFGAVLVCFLAKVAVLVGFDWLTSSGFCCTLGGSAVL